MDENMVGYLLNALDPEDHREVEDYLRDHPEAQARLELLRQALTPLECDKETLPPAAGLTFRTLARVAEQHCQDLPPPEERAEAESDDVDEDVPDVDSLRPGLPDAPPVLPMRETSAEPPWWRRADYLVAAVLFLAVGGLAIMMIQEWRDESKIAGCKNNLHGYHTRLVDYSLRNDDRFPSVADQPHPRNVAGIVVPILAAAGQTYGQPWSIRCPGEGPHLDPQWTLEELEALAPEEFEQRAHQLCPSYAYTLGYRDESGKHCGLKKGNEYVPIMADRAWHGNSHIRGNSPNHRGKGQNVLYAGGNVRFLAAPARDDEEGDHIYLNHNNEVKAGLRVQDAVLGSSADRP